MLPNPVLHHSFQFLLRDDPVDGGHHLGDLAPQMLAENGPYAFVALCERVPAAPYQARPTRPGLERAPQAARMTAAPVMGTGYYKSS